MSLCPIRKLLVKRKEIFYGCREELTGVTIPLKYLPCNKKITGWE
jgi:hypothetical protein